MEEDLEAVFAMAIRPRLYIPPLRTTFEPKAWAPAEISGITNGYTYALDIPSAGDAKPGQLMQKPIHWDLDVAPRSLLGKSFTQTQVHQAAIDDGLYYIGNFVPADHANPTEHVVAFFTREGRANSMPEMLFARRDDNGLWSYRPPIERGGCNGSGLPRQVDYKKQPITDILAADLGPFTKFLGCAAIPYEGIHYYPRT